MAPKPVHSIHVFQVEAIDGGEIWFADYSGKKIMVVNVASECGYTPQYQQLQELYEAFGDTLTIVGFPSNDFGGQEPGTNQQIRIFCTTRYGVTFPLAAKSELSSNPVFQWLCHKERNGVMDCRVTWNFHKFLLDGSGRLVGHYPASVSPLDEEILAWLNA